MTFRVADLSSSRVAEALIGGWRSHFPGAGQVAELGVWTRGCAEQAEAVRAAWARVLKPPDCFVDARSESFPELAGFAVRFEPGLGGTDAERRLGLVADAWDVASSLAPDAQIVSQGFCAYGFPRPAPAELPLRNLRDALGRFQRLEYVGNLSFPSPGQEDELFQFAVPEANTWRSDLSQGAIRLAFLGDDHTDFAEEHRQLTAVLGPQTEGHEWVRDVYLNNPEPIGKAILLVYGTRDVDRCGISADAWDFFRLKPTAKALICFSSSRDKHCLYSFRAPSTEPAGAAGQGHGWPLPDRPIYRNLYCVGLEFVWK